MNLTAILFTLAILLLLSRVFLVKARANRLDNPEFQALPKEVRLAVLKDRLLSAPTETNLQNLVTFATELGITADANSYRSLMQTQVKLSGREDALVEDNELFSKEAAFMDSITPPEIGMAKEAKEQGNIQEYIDRSLEAVTRFYSDEKIEETLESLIPDFSKAEELLQGYRELTKARDESLADEESIKKLREKRIAWENSLHA